MKKFFAILLALSMVLSMAACGAPAKAEEAAPAEQAPAAAYTAGTYTATES